MALLQWLLHHIWALWIMMKMYLKSRIYTTLTHPWKCTTTRCMTSATTPRNIFGFHGYLHNRGELKVLVPVRVVSLHMSYNKWCNKKKLWCMLNDCLYRVCIMRLLSHIYIPVSCCAKWWLAFMNMKILIFEILWCKNVLPNLFPVTCWWKKRVGQ